MTKINSATNLLFLALTTSFVLSINLMNPAQNADATILVLGDSLLPSNCGSCYTEKFQAIYMELATSYDLPLIPFLLEGVAGNPEPMQQDGIHQRVEAQPLILDNVWLVLSSVLEAES